MAAPSTVTIRSLSGNYTMNKSLSDSQDPFLALQGISWFTRKAVGLATVTLVIKQYEKEGVNHIDVTSTASGLSSSQEDRVLSWVERGHEDKLFGKVKGRSRFTTKAGFEPAIEGLADDEKKYLLAERLKDGSPSAFLDDEYVQSVATSDDGQGWTVDQIWGFETVNNERRYTRRLVCKNGSKTQVMRLVYDYNGPLDG